ncbi:MAG TPA: hypothetical protein VLX92_26775 [Kofleriaceae bacterium]|nr:hypothetical protein [Kofleriaceae bacterium]
MRRAWISVAAFVVSPFALLATGGLPPDVWWRDVVWLGLLAIAVIACVRGRCWFVLAATPLWLVAVGLAMDAYYPCWPASNAAWCGHFCDDDPCSCTSGAYGAGTGCHD